MNRSAIAIRHVAFEGLGTFAPILAEHGYAVTVLDAGVDDLSAVGRDDPDLVVILGGPIGVGQTTSYPFLDEEIALAADRLARSRPTLGICLGSQIMAAALGSAVYPAQHKEIGWGPITLTEDGKASPLRHLSGAPVLHWHGDTFDLPSGSTLLCSTDLCRNQAFAVGQHALGLQFHAEFDGHQIERWLIGHASELGTAGIDPRMLRSDTALHASSLAGAGTALVRDWLAALPS